MNLGNILKIESLNTKNRIFENVQNCLHLYFCRKFSDLPPISQNNLSQYK